MNEAFKEEKQLILALASGKEDAFSFLYDNFGATLFKRPDLSGLLLASEVPKAKMPS